MINRLYGLRHHVVVGGNDDNHKVGHLGAAGTHSRKRLVTGSIEECDMAPVGQLHIIRTYMLGDTACLTGNNISFANIVEKRSLAMVDVTHDGDNRRTALEVFLAVFLLMNGIGNLCRHIFCREAEFVGHDIDSLGIKTLVDGNHHAEIHTRCDNVVDRNIHHRRKVVCGNEFSDFEYAALRFLCLMGLTLSASCGLTFLLTPFGTFLKALVFGSQTCESLFYLLLYVFFIYIRCGCRTLGLLAATVFTLIVAALAALVASTALIAVFAVLLTVTALRTSVTCTGGTAHLLDIYFFLAAYTAAFLAVSLVACSATLGAVALGIAAAAPVIASFFLRTCILIERIEVDFAHDIERRPLHFTLESEDFWLGLGIGLCFLGLGGLCLGSFLLGFCLGHLGFGCGRLRSLGFRGRRLWGFLLRCFGFGSPGLRSGGLGCFLLRCFGFWGLGLRSGRFGCILLRCLGFGSFGLRSGRLGSHRIIILVKLDFA